MSRYHTHGNAKPWRCDGYQRSPRVPGPVVTDEQAKPGRWIVALVCLVLFAAVCGAADVSVSRPSQTPSGANP